jgi:hypothetical protein
MIDEKEAFIQRMETISEIAGSTERQAKKLFREVQRMAEEYEKRWPTNKSLNPVDNTMNML